MRKVSTNDFRKNLADYLDKVAENETSIVVSRFDKPLVKIVPYKEEDEKFRDFFGFLPGDGESGEEYVNKVRRSAKEKEYVKALRSGKKKRE